MTHSAEDARALRDAEAQHPDWHFFTSDSGWHYAVHPRHRTASAKTADGIGRAIEAREADATLAARLAARNRSAA